MTRHAATARCQHDTRFVAKTLAITNLKPYETYDKALLAEGLYLCTVIEGEAHHPTPNIY